MSDTQAHPLRAFASHLRLNQVNLTERWMKAVFRDAERLERANHELILKIVCELAQLLGAQIRFVSQQGEGTTFEITFPLEFQVTA
jgi:signal transduction histidine kinase